jgi:hypothetical protein
MVPLRPAGVQKFFRYARLRHEVYLRRQQGLPPPWTNDPVLREYRFTNIFRETDRTTQWFREHVRDRYDGTPEVLPATVVFRWFNKIETGEAMWACEEGFRTYFDSWLRTGDVPALRARIRHARGDGPYVNGAYIIKSPNGMSKLDGVLHACELFRTTKQPSDHGIWQWDWRDVADKCLKSHWSLENMWTWLRQHDYQGDFTAYEVVTDLRHTHLLRGAPDIMTWANAGPGAVRGLNRVQGRPVAGSLRKHESLAEMQALLARSQSRMLWPPEWGHWEMREVEHTLCEYDKWERARTGEGTPKQRYAGT